VDVTLRPVEDGDLAAFFAFQADPASVQMAGVPARDADAFDAHWARLRSDPEIVLRTIEAGGQVAGNIGCWPREGEQHLGYWLGREFWGQGVASQAVAAFLAMYAARPLVARVLPTNAGSLRVLATCGFVATGTVMEDVEVVMLRLDG
jgi:RimJ/RimL family protein N-acetyltransferase